MLDNYGTHKAPKVAAWFKRRPRYHLHFTPTSGSWLNQIERWFAKLTEQRLRRSAFHSVAELERAIRLYLASNNRQPTPFVWTASADLILGKVGAPCSRINRSGHSPAARRVDFPCFGSNQNQVMTLTRTPPFAWLRLASQRHRLDLQIPSSAAIRP